MTLIENSMSQKSKPKPSILSWKLVEPSSAADTWLLRVFARSWTTKWQEHPVSFDWEHSRESQPLIVLNYFAARQITKECPQLAHALGVNERGLIAQSRQPRPRMPDGQSKRVDANEYRISTEDASRFITEWSGRLRQLGHEVFIPTSLLGESTRRLFVIRRSPVDQNESSGLFSPSNLLQFRWDVVLDGQPIDITELERLAELKRPLIKWRGKWIFFDPQQWSAEKLLQIAEHLRQHPIEQLQPSSALQTLLATFQEWNGVPIESTGGEGNQCNWFARLTHRSPLYPVPKPDGLRADLRHYQQDGLNWLAFMSANGFGACLADDMGLGKTLQTLAWFEHDNYAGNTGKCLLVCPTSLVRNWQKEGGKFTPNLRLYEHHGSNRARTSQSLLANARGTDLVITTYGTMSQDLEVLREIPWRAVILDEAQNIKNSETTISRAARRLGENTPFRLALTGTPIENSVLDLWTLFDFLNPGLLGTKNEFKAKFSSLLTSKKVDSSSVDGQREQAAESLQQLTNPFILRRKKSDPLIVPELPDKIEIDECCYLTIEQAELYRAVLKETEEELDMEERGQRYAIVSKLIRKLKQACNHPSLLLKDRSPLGERSGKLNRLVEMLETVLALNEKALIFTQYAEMGRMLDHFLLERLNVGTQFLCGDDAIGDRETKVGTFTKDARFPIFILTLKAGGTGLNLQAANHVFHFDRWWNPAVEDQATDRAYRIGQSKDVNVYKFVCAGTVEERIAELISRKRELADMVIGGDLDGSLASALCQKTNEELRDFFRLDAEAVCEE